MLDAVVCCLVLVVACWLIGVVALYYVPLYIYSVVCGLLCWCALIVARWPLCVVYCWCCVVVCCGSLSLRVVRCVLLFLWLVH